MHAQAALLEVERANGLYHRRIGKRNELLSRLCLRQNGQLPGFCQIRNPCIGVLSRKSRQSEDDDNMRHSCDFQHSEDPYQCPEQAIGHVHSQWPLTNMGIFLASIMPEGALSSLSYSRKTRTNLEASPNGSQLPGLAWREIAISICPLLSRRT